ncbi:hypothetical protein SUBVAR_05231 [Subdoligranulum variabile DSM 15176]|uniref:Uncharacterized protein n=1 Tax=Subdoligranulum variabile DSM 15176 TaxID=411471 RepID=D1PLL6_9FIRM|nr:hypothetical protein SUBVAR_05231 [Subdoligranulum variabile DSM 15176]
MCARNNVIFVQKAYDIFVKKGLYYIVDETISRRETGKKEDAACFRLEMR